MKGNYEDDFYTPIRPQKFEEHMENSSDEEGSGDSSDSDLEALHRQNTPP